MIQFSITSPEGYWIRFGLGVDRNSTTDGFTISGAYGIIEDQFMAEDSEMQTDSQNDYKMTVSGSSIKTFAVTRNLDSSDSLDFKILDGEIMITYSYGEGTEFTKESTVFEGEFTLAVKSKLRDVFLVHNITRELDGGGSSDTILLHGLLTYIAWDIFSMMLILSGRYSKYFYSFRIYMHTVLGIATLVFNIIGVGYGTGESESVNGLGDSHTSIAGIVTAWTIATC